MQLEVSHICPSGHPLSKQTIEQESIKEVRTVADIVDLVERIRAK